MPTSHPSSSLMGIYGCELKDIDVRQAVRAFGQDVVDKLLACFGSARFDAEAKSEATDKIDAQLHSLCKAKQQLQKSANTNSMCFIE